MAKKLGSDYRLWIESATPGTYNQILGNQALSISRSGQTIDMATKDDGAYGAQAAGSKGLSLQAGFIPNLPDTTGYDRFQALARASTTAPFNVQIRKGGSSGATPADVVFLCSMYCTQDDNDFAMNAGMTAGFTLVAAAAPTTDLIA